MIGSVFRTEIWTLKRGEILFVFGAWMGLVPAMAQEPEAAVSPPALYRMGAASEAVLRCHNLRIVDTGAQADAYRDARARDFSSRAMVMGIEDFSNEFASAYAKGTEQAVCDKYLRLYPSLLTRRRIGLRD